MSKLNPRRQGVAKTIGDIAGTEGIVPVYSDSQKLRRLVMANMLWENTFYVEGRKISDEIEDVVKSMLQKGEYATVIEIAKEARTKYTLRHIPLFLLDLCVEHDTVRRNHASAIIDAYDNIISRADMIVDVLALYTARRGVIATKIPKVIKKALGRSFEKFNEYQFGKYSLKRNEITMRDAIRLVHPKPSSQERQILYNNIAKNTLPSPDTWEVSLSAAKTQAERTAVWTNLISSNKLGDLATLRNLRNMLKDDVPTNIIKKAINQVKGTQLVPFNIMRAYIEVPQMKYEIAQLFRRCAESRSPLPGKTLIILDVSGSMGSSLSSKSKVTRQEAANALAFEISIRAEEAALVITGGNDGTRQHKSEFVRRPAGQMSDFLYDIDEKSHSVGGGGIFTRQVIEWAKSNADIQKFNPDRIVVISDSQDIDQARGDTRIAQPWAKTNYIIDISCDSNGILLNKRWNAKISGFSAATVDFICELEKMSNQQNP